MIFSKAADHLKKLFSHASDPKVIDAIHYRNIRNVVVISMVACILDAVTLAFFTAANWDKPNFWRTFISVGWCVLACLVIAVLSKKLLNARKTRGAVPRVGANLLVVLFYVVLSAWGIMVDIAHYSNGEQMLTFYIVQFCALCFVVMPPKLGSVLIVLSFSSLYVCTYLADKAVNMQPQNYIVLTVIAILGNAIQYMMLQDTEKSKLDNLALIDILKHEAAVDDLTKLKNRKALRSDFNKNIGKNVYVVMADVDSFKAYNDTHGHLSGDTVLRKVADTLIESFCGDDVYRYGGDEFLMVVADSTDEEFFEKISAWKKALGEICIPGISQPVSCSFGFERRFLEENDDLRDAIKVADKRLYEAKNKLEAKA